MPYNLLDLDVEILILWRYSRLTALAVGDELEMGVLVFLDQTDVEDVMPFGVWDLQIVV
jgi:hypothetical protein